MGLESSGTEEKVEQKKLETPEEVIAQSEEILRKAALEGREDYSLAILDAVYEGYKRNLEALEKVSFEEKKIWETEALNATYPRAYLIWDEIQGSKLEPNEREIARIIAQRAIEVESEKAGRLRKGEAEQQTEETYYLKMEWAQKIEEIFYPNLQEIEKNLRMKSIEIASKTEGGHKILNKILSEIGEEQEKLNHDATSHMEKIKRDLQKFYRDMKDRLLNREMEKQRYPNVKANELCDNTSRYSAVAMGVVRVPYPCIDEKQILIEVMRRNPSIVQELKDKYGDKLLMGDEEKILNSVRRSGINTQIFYAYRAIKSEKQE